MKRNFKYFFIVWFVGLLLFNAITFLVPNDIFGIARFDKPMFWIAYAFITLSFVCQIITAYMFIKDDSADKTFLNIPLLSTGYVTLIISIIVGCFFMILPIIPTWIGILICLFVAGYFIIACVKATIVINTVKSEEVEIKTKTEFIRTAVVEVESLIYRATTNEISEEIKKVYEALKYSDPITTPALNCIEQEINKDLKILKQAVVDKDFERVLAVVPSIIANIKERNSKCKILK